MKRQTKRSTCRHESGHVVVSLVLGFQIIESVGVWRANGDWGGEVRFAQTPGRMIDQELASTALLVVIAGVLAEYPELDASEIADQLPTSDRVPFFASLGIASDDGNQKAVLAQAVDKTKAILIENHELVGEIARLLFRRNRINGEEVRELFAATTSNATE